MIKKLIFIILLNFLTFNFVNAGESTAHFVRASDIKTVGQGVKLYIGKEYIGKVWTNNYAVAKTETGKRKITTKVGLSIGVPVTGLGGAKKFKSKIYEFKVSPRSDSFLPIVAFGLLGQLADTSINEQSGLFQISVDKFSNR